jgi:hypothetical protein
LRPPNQGGIATCLPGHRYGLILRRRPASGQKRIQRSDLPVLYQFDVGGLTLV